ncbi:MAG: peroxiredoxin [Candidatus Nanopelagicales bacterium]|nr:peroxiredoxin [Candidatus Nanopelagicales bacterium]MCF8539238.1 peroxiredoxin [Candidatus Nanopelagicales bacterium]MCF8550785.1 peroxiredoxin [Candidatus Nanopelagicales bacterium]
MSISVGDLAPDFTLSNQFGEAVTLSDFRGKKNVVVMFYPFAFTGICTGELCTIRDRRPDFINDTTEVLSISCDPAPSLKVFSEQENLTHNLLSDFYPHGKVAKEYGAFLEDKGFATRAAFVIDKDGIIRWSVVNGPGEARNADDYLTALAELG